MDSAQVEEKIIAGEAVEERNKKIVIRFYQDVIKAGDMNMIEKTLSSNYHLSTPYGEVASPGRQGFIDLYTDLIRAFPCMHLEIKEIVSENSTVAVRYEAHGTNEGELFGLKPTGKSWSVSGVDIFLISDDKILEQWCLIDLFSLRRQLGYDLSV